MSHTFEELVEKQRAADAAHAQVQALRNTYGAPAHGTWTEVQTEMYETAVRAWRDLARDAQAALNEYARDEGRSRTDVEADVKDLKSHGVVFEDYDMPGLKTVNSIANMGMYHAAWFRDADGNILAIGDEPN